MDLNHRPVFKKILDAWNSGGPDKLVELSSSFIVYEHMGSNYLIARGKEQLKDYLESLFRSIPNLTFEFTDSAWNDPAFFLEWVGKGNLVGNRYGVNGKGTPIRIDGVAVMIMNEDEKIVEMRTYFNDAQIAKEVKFPDLESIE